MINQVLLATYTSDELKLYRRWAEQLGCGLELHAFANPAVLSQNGQLEQTLTFYEEQLAGFRGRLGFHGAFYDMVSASVDPGVVALTRQRYWLNLEIARRLGGEYVVFHANYMGGFKLTNYRLGWHERQVAFWRSFMDDAEKLGVYVLLENMWADEPGIIGTIVEDVGHPYLKVCLDIAHAFLFSDYPIEAWIDILAPHLYCCHVNNNDGLLDLHWSLDHGVMHYPPLIHRLSQIRPAPLFTLEMPDLATIASSLPFFGLKAPA